MEVSGRMIKWLETASTFLCLKINTTKGMFNLVQDQDSDAIIIKMETFIKEIG
jgi:hypothetical protein